MKVTTEIGLPPGAFESLEFLASLEPKLDAALVKSMDMLGAVVLNRIRTNFRMEKDPDGAAWIPSKAGQERKAKGQGQTLFETGRLWHSIQLYRPSEKQRVIGTDVEYAGWLNDGTSKLPPRPFIAFPSDVETVGLSLMERAVKEVFK